jgi:SanA protein
LKKKRRFGNILSILGWTIILVLGLIGSIEIMVKLDTRLEIYTSVDQIPANKVGLLLGTSKYLTSGQPNLFYRYRIDAAVELFNAGKIEFILISGDNASRYYNEPETIRRDLIKKGVPSNRIFLDYAGFRTLDSIVRAREIFGQERITIISQKFHDERALFISNRRRVQAVAFTAKEVEIKSGLKTFFRERFARIKMVSDLLLNKEPKFLGEKIEIK